jgi:hypothetical protein
MAQKIILVNTGLFVRERLEVVLLEIQGCASGIHGQTLQLQSI